MVTMRSHVVFLNTPFSRIPLHLPGHCNCTSRVCSCSQPGQSTSQLLYVAWCGRGGDEASSHGCACGDVCRIFAEFSAIVCFGMRQTLLDPNFGRFSLSLVPMPSVKQTLYINLLLRPLRQCATAHPFPFCQPFLSFSLLRCLYS